jgi:2-keto-4-pentenoate hydratase
VGSQLEQIADRLIAAQDGATMLVPFTHEQPELGVADAYAVMEKIEARRRAQGWRPVGRKVGFTNTTIWPRYGVWQPNWAHVWAETVHHAKDGRTSLALRSFVQPRIEPEVVFGLNGPVTPSDDPEAVLASVAWIAPGFEIVQSHFPDWKFKVFDCTANCALHGALVVGAQVPVTAASRAAVAAMLPTFTLTLSRGDTVIDRGVGANVLKSPALALAHLARVLADLPQFPPLAAGEIVTTGTITDAWPVLPGETWSSDYGTLGLAGMTLTFT